MATRATFLCCGSSRWTRLKYARTVDERRGACEPGGESLSRLDAILVDEGQDSNLTGDPDIGKTARDTITGMWGDFRCHLPI